MVKFPEADKRLFRNKFVCRKCKSVVRAPSRKVAEKQVRCRNCNSRVFKAKRKK